MSTQDENKYQNEELAKELGNYCCPSCGIPFSGHLGLIGACKELQIAKAQVKWHKGCEDKCGEALESLQAENQRLTSELNEAKKDKDISIRDWCEIDTEIKLHTSKFGVSDCHPDIPGDHGRFKSALECVEEMTRALQAEDQRLRSALEKIRNYASDKNSLSYEGWLSGIEDLADEALSPSAASSGLEALKLKAGAAQMYCDEAGRLRDALDEIYALSESCSFERLREVIGKHLSPSAPAETESVQTGSKSVEGEWREMIGPHSMDEAYLPPMGIPIWLYLPDVGQPTVGLREEYEGGWIWAICYSHPYWDKDEQKWCANNAEADDIAPSHWMPLPLPPSFHPATANQD